MKKSAVITLLLLMGPSLNPLLAARPALPQPGQSAPAVQAINALGLELLVSESAPPGNALLSPYSIQMALAMTYAGAAGTTLSEMQRVLHYPMDETALHESLAGLRSDLEAMTAASSNRAATARQRGETMDPVSLTMANRLFGQRGYEFRTPFLELLHTHYDAPLQLMDFQQNWDPARQEINTWVEDQTGKRIRDLIPAGGLTRETRLVLVNALHLKAPWAESFPERATKPEPFRVQGTDPHPVATMSRKGRFGYMREGDHTVVRVPYAGGELHFLILLPDAVDGLDALTKQLTAERLTALRVSRSEDVILHLPKFKLEPPSLKLGKALQSLGMRTAFDQPRGTANFDRMAPRRQDDYLRISEVFHKTFLELDEKGTEAAAATAVSMVRTTAIPVHPAQPIEVRVDRPFLFAIQHRSSGACLFLGRVLDPR